MTRANRHSGEKLRRDSNQENRCEFRHRFSVVKQADCMHSRECNQHRFSNRRNLHNSCGSYRVATWQRIPNAISIGGRQENRAKLFRKRKKFCASMPDCSCLWIVCRSSEAASPAEFAPLTTSSSRWCWWAAPITSRCD